MDKISGREVNLHSLLKKIRSDRIAWLKQHCSQKVVAAVTKYLDEAIDPVLEMFDDTVVVSHSDANRIERFVHDATNYVLKTNGINVRPQIVAIFRFFFRILIPRLEVEER